VEATVTENADGTVRVAIDGAGRLHADRALLFGIVAGAADYLVVLRPAGAVLGRWNGAAWAPFAHRALGPRAAGERFTFSLALDDLGTPTFDYWLAAVQGDAVVATPEWGTFTSLRA
jgi:hypothetical protein